MAHRLKHGNIYNCFTWAHYGSISIYSFKRENVSQSMRDEDRLLVKSKSEFQIRNEHRQNKQSENTETVNTETQNWLQLWGSRNIVSTHYTHSMDLQLRIFLNCSHHGYTHALKKSDQQCDCAACVIRRGIQLCLCLCLSLSLPMPMSVCVPVSVPTPKAPFPRADLPRVARLEALWQTVPFPRADLPRAARLEALWQIVPFPRADLPRAALARSCCIVV
jgi:hypothetical protein